VETFFQLVQAIELKSSIERFRISSIEPNLLTSEMISFLGSSSKFVPHFHIPLQSGSNAVLRLMKRRYQRELYVDRVSSIKSVMPTACIGVDVIVGHPGETPELFLETYEFLNALDISYLHVFPYSERPNTYAVDMEPKVDSMQKAAGTQINFDSANADKALGTAMRKLTSNYGTRANLIDALDLANQTATKYGMKIEDDVINQLIFVNELDRLFGAQAQTSLKGQVAEAMETGVDIARGGGASRAFELLAEKAENLRGINKENAVKAMEELLKRK
jgi:radical SAM superfamily enzyme YgiQ (UPF0313 family)